MTVGETAQESLRRRGFVIVRTPGRCYTAGLPISRGHPDLLIAGLPAPIAYELLSAACDQIGASHAIVEGQQEFVGHQGVVVAGIAHSQLARAARASYLLCGDRCRALQIIFADSSGCLPWEAGYRGAPVPLFINPRDRTNKVA